MLNDIEQRLAAINPNFSYIVQAPAGSGKTEILTQRYLKLLSLVTAPEQIIAITFTRKAANEMRQRIITALEEAHDDLPIRSKHQEITRNIAQQALMHSNAMDWQILEQTNRLKIITIDALCQSLSKSIPILENQIPYANICDNPEKYYQQAARATLKYSEDNSNYHHALKSLLLHIDNRQDYLIQLLVNLLAQRDQWLYSFYQAKTQQRSLYENALELIIQHEIEHFKKTIPQQLLHELLLCVQQLLQITSQEYQDFNTLDANNLRKLAKILLTSQNNLRQAFDHHVGLKKGVASDYEIKQLKLFSKKLLNNLNSLPNFKDALLKVKQLPQAKYSDNQWNIIQALFDLLPLLLAHLQLLFKQHNEVDFITITEQALLGLGTEDDPTDLSLYLDYSIQHILVDEFQDTSIQQFKLLTQLVQGWQPDDGRTLFIVGDPMQSIYRFRSAEVGLFLRAKQLGIGPVKLRPLELTSNFRSTPELVHWVNLHFNNIFPKYDDIESGAISFSKSGSTIVEKGHIESCAYNSKEEEAEAIVTLAIKQLHEYPNDNIVILVRSRTQLNYIVHKLKEQRIPFQGVEIDLLSKLPHLRDIYTLTQSLLMPTNRLAWLALLRTPLCGLPLNDLLRIANFSPQQSIYYALQHLDEIDGLSKETYARAKFVFNVLAKALALRAQTSLLNWIENTLKELHYEQILDSWQQKDIQQFYALLERFDDAGLISDWQQFNDAFNKLYATQITIPTACSTTPNHSLPEQGHRLQIMTIHKAKGLEFDCVILPGLGSKPTKLNQPLFRWLKLPTTAEDLFLISPLKAAEQEQCLLYDYLGKLDNEKSYYEMQRLLYVAVTRAKKRLYLFDQNTKITANSFRDLLSQQEFSTTTIANTHESKTNLPQRYYLPDSFYAIDNLITHYIPERGVSKNWFPDNVPKLVGIITHELLQWICNNHPSNLEEIPWQFVIQQIKKIGLDEKQILPNIKQQISNLFIDPIGHWIIQKHNNEHNEYAIIVQEDDNFNTKIIDRLFYENDTIWIVDFKTGIDDADACTKHQQQLNNYAKALAATPHSIYSQHLKRALDNNNQQICQENVTTALYKVENAKTGQIFDNYMVAKAHKINLGLYYLANSSWMTWEYQNEFQHN